MVMRETLDGFQGGLQIGGQMITNLRYVDNIMLATSEAELQELVNRLDCVSRKYSLRFNVDKTRVMNNWVPDYRRWRVYNEFRTRLYKGQVIGAENMEKSQHTDFNKDATYESASMACSNIWL